MSRISTCNPSTLIVGRLGSLSHVTYRNCIHVDYLRHKHSILLSIVPLILMAMLHVQTLLLRPLGEVKWSIRHSALGLGYQVTDGTFLCLEIEQMSPFLTYTKVHFLKILLHILTHKYHPGTTQHVVELNYLLYFICCIFIFLKGTWHEVTDMQ